MSKSKKFNFIEQVLSNDIDINLIREYEAQCALDFLRDEDREEDQPALDYLLYNCNDYLCLKDELFLSRMQSLYDEETLKVVLNDLIEIKQSIEREKSDAILLDGEKRYEITKADYT